MMRKLRDVSKTELEVTLRTLLKVKLPESEIVIGSNFGLISVFDFIVFILFYFVLWLEYYSPLDNFS